MRAGKLDRLVCLIRETEIGQSDLREPITEPTIIRTFYADVERTGATETTVNGQRMLVQSVTVQCRFFTGLLSTDALEVDGTTYAITGFTEIGRREGWSITAESRQ